MPEVDPTKFCAIIEEIVIRQISAQENQVVDIIRCFGVGFGACHTEFVMTNKGPRLIEINYRNIGDYREFLMVRHARHSVI